MNELMATNFSMTTSDPAAIAAAETAKARIQCAYQMAIYRPRDIDQTRIKMLKLCKNPFFAESFTASKPIGGKSVKVTSIRAAESLAREFRNIQPDIEVVYEDEKIVREKVTVTDFETNVSYSKPISLHKTVERKDSRGREVISERINSYGEKVYLVVATEDEMLTKINAQESKVLRGLILRLIDAGLVEECRIECENTLKNKDKEDPEAAKKKLLDAFASVGVMPQDLADYLKHPVNQIVPAELTELRNIYTALKDGDAKWSDYVSSAEEKEPVRSKFEAANDLLGAEGK